MEELIFKINLTVEGQDITVKQDKLRDGLVGLVFVYVDFKLWGDFNNIMRFYYGDGVPIERIMNGSPVEVPPEVIKAPGFGIAIGGYGKSGAPLEKFIPTMEAEIKVERSGYGGKEAIGSEEAEQESFTAEILAIAKTAENVPYIGENGNWYIYDVDAKEYTDSGKQAQGEQGIQGIQGEQGIQGIQGVQGEQGESGYTPQKSVDYFTAEEVAEIESNVASKVTKQSIGLGNVDNTSDINKPVSTKQQEAIDAIKNTLEARIFLLEVQYSKAYLERTDFSYAFANTGYTLLPMSDITATSIIYMLMNCQSLTTCEGVTVTVNSDNPSALYVCSNCSEMEIAPSFIFKTADGAADAQVVRTWTSAFLNCASMTTCEVYLGDGTQNPVTARNMFQNTFKNCTNLENLTFLGQGSPMHLDLSDCKNLTAESLQSLKSALMDVSQAQSGVYEIKMAQVTYDLYTAEEKAEITALGWVINAIQEEE